MNNFRRLCSYSLLHYFNRLHYCILPRRGLRTAIKVNEYLLDRSVPPSHILTNLKEEDAKELEDIKVYHEFLRSSGQLVPKQLKDEHYVELLCLSKNQRLKYYLFLAKTEFKKENEIMRAKAKITRKEQEEHEDTPEHPTNRFISKYHNKSLLKLENHRLIQSMILQSQEIVIDNSFEDEMSRMEVKNLSKQLMYCYALNKTLDEPFQMVLANMNRKNILYNDLANFARVGREKCTYSKLEEMPWRVDERHYLDIFPGRRIVYLSPNSHNYFNQGEYDHNAVHIIGGIVDKSGQLPLTLARARREGIDHRAFPIDRFIPWKSGGKSLTIDQAMKIMAIARETNGDWKTALEKSIPSRSLIDNSGKNQRRMLNDMAEKDGDRQ